MKQLLPKKIMRWLPMAVIALLLVVIGLGAWQLSQLNAKISDQDDTISNARSQAATLRQQLADVSATPAPSASPTPTATHTNPSRRQGDN